jgi:hypothetical protein
MAAERTPKVHFEAWVVCAWIVVAAEFVLAIVLGLKRPGAMPVKVYLYGPFLIAASSLGVGIAGLVWSARRRPFAQPQRLVAFCVLAFAIGTSSYPLPFPSARSSRPSAVRVRFPLEGEWTTAWGGENEINHHLRVRPDRRYGFDFVLAQDGALRRDAADPTSAFAWDREVLAPAGGTVVRVEHDLADDGVLHGHDLGNHVVIEIAPDEFLFVAGLRQGSITVRPGDSVAAGAPIGRIGFSCGSPTLPEPHLSLHVQDTPDPIWGQGIPFYFFESAIDGVRVARSVPDGRGYFAGHALAGQRIAHAP